MATLCTSCGTPLRENAKFCNNCGTLTPSHPFSPKATPSSNSVQAPANGRSDNTRPALREQIAHLPQNTARPVRRFVQGEPPSWMSRLDDDNSNGNNKRASSDRYDADKAPQLDFPVPEPLPRPNSPNSSRRELRVKVWQQEEPISSPGLPRQDSDALLDRAIDDLPTSPLVASSSAAPASLNSISAPTRSEQDRRLDELERMDTAHLAAPAPMPLSQPASQPSQGKFDQSFAPAQQPASSLVRGTLPEAATRHNEPAFLRPTTQSAQSNILASRVAQSQPLKQTSSSSAPATIAQRKQKRKPLVLVAGLLVILLIGAIGVWVGVFHPFSVPAVVQSQQSFSNSQLAFSVQYPSGWTTRVDNSSSSAFFADSSNTAQFTVTVSAANGKDAGQYVQQLANQLKMTSIKAGTPLSFGGASWQQVQGNALFSGANYSETILATVHNNQLYTIIQAAPQSTYTQEEQVVFSTMRASFKFV
ncbi:MAG TPA: zinc-ribbon domain-containing protein [Ktedonobacteraceae bacterium]|nr:zinc-ribbon domain-containing protein [Ktedonobacteraceae bacterium]